ncbi:MAG: C69 family dipeptidase [Bacteroidales bacterium]
MRKLSTFLGVSTLTLVIVLTISLGTSVNVNAQDPTDPNSLGVRDACTSIMVGCNASTDGSVMTAHACDARYRTWMKWEPAKIYDLKGDDKGATETIYKGMLHTADEFDSHRLTKVGEIPQVPQVYSFLNTAYPCLNEKQLAIGETTIGGSEILRNKNGMFLIEELEKIALERCDNARDAIRIIGELVEKYGYGDWGECITIADTKEVWQLEIFGAGPDKIGSVWAAERIPDGNIGVSANICRISTLSEKILKNTDYYMASENVFSLAKKLNLWDGKSEFKFWKVYGDVDSYTKVLKPFWTREYFILNHFAPSLHLNMDMEELPFSVKPDNKVSVEDVMAMYREVYEDTQWDMTKNLKMAKEIKDEDGNVIRIDSVRIPIANPWMNGDDRKSINALKPGAVEYQRVVAVAWCSYTFIAQLRDWLPDEIGGRIFLSFDNAAQSPRIPIYCGMNTLPQEFSVCGQHGVKEDAIIWNYRKANKLATVSWQNTKELHTSYLMHFQDEMMKDCPIVESRVQELLKAGKKDEATKYLNNYTRDFVGATSYAWHELEKIYWRKFDMGF